jgi:hypothetical protein
LPQIIHATIQCYSRAMARRRVAAPRLSQQPGAVAASADSADRTRGIRPTTNPADRTRGIRPTTNPADRTRGIRSTTNPTCRSWGISSANPANRARGIRSSSTCHDITSSQKMVSEW